jgi:hypothetical protein
MLSSRSFVASAGRKIIPSNTYLGALVVELAAFEESVVEEVL